MDGMKETCGYGACRGRERRIFTMTVVIAAGMRKRKAVAEGVGWAGRR